MTGFAWDDDADRDFVYVTPLDVTRQPMGERKRVQAFTTGLMKAAAEATLEIDRTHELGFIRVEWQGRSYDHTLSPQTLEKGTPVRWTSRFVMPLIPHVIDGL